MPIEWSRLKPYQHDKRKSFEELCYQIAKSKYSSLGRFTSVDDSGGGDGVEFYLTLPNGDEWGWQAKFYFPDKRLTSSRRNSVVDSLRVSLSKHAALKKWFLCTPTNLSPKGERSEVSWFTTDLQAPAGHVELVHWGESDFVDFLADPRLAGKRHYFFGDLELTAEWFAAQVGKQLANVGEKFIERLHSATYVDTQVHHVVGDDVLLDTLEARGSELSAYATSIEEKVRELSSRLGSEWNDIVGELTTRSGQVVAILRTASAAVGSAVSIIRGGDIGSTTSVNLEPFRQAFLSGAETYYKACADVHTKLHLQRSGQNPPKKERSSDSDSKKIYEFRSAIDADNALGALFAAESALSTFRLGYLHVIANAGFGKTHLTCHIVSSRVASGLPAILLLGEQFGKNDTIEDRIRQICDIPPSYSWADFVAALEAYAEACGTRVLIAIDALNEAESVAMWKRQLAGFMSTIVRSGRVTLVTTSRSSYEEQIWSPQVEGLIYLRGFIDSNLAEAVDKYFQYFRIKADFTFESIEQFRNPLYLRIFCEAVNRERRTEKTVFVGRQYVLSVFEQFLERRNTSFSEHIHKPASLNLLQDLLRRFAKQLWQQSARHLTLAEAVQLLDGKSAQAADFDWHASFTKALLNEELLISRDALGGKETVSFTYDLLGGYLIADELLKVTDKESSTAFTKSPAFIAKMADEDYGNRHPLHEDILRCYLLLFPIRTGEQVYKLNVKQFYSSSISALFEADPLYIRVAESREIQRLFGNPANRRPLLQLARNVALVPDHPFNIRFWNKLLRGLPMVERDLSWTELIRDETQVFRDTVDALEQTCRARKKLSSDKERLGLAANYVAWTLVSTDRILRDTATRALYWYGRRFPASLFNLTLWSLRVNDPYVSERMLAAAYGVCMALHCRPKRPLFRTRLLPALAKNVYDKMFAPSAQHSTTHALSRDFARRIIEVARLHAPSLFSQTKLARTIPPFKDGGIREWQVMEDPNDDKYREGNAPLGMDFANYTIGGLVPGRQNYQFEHEEYKRVVGQIVWRIYQLGYSLESFSEIDKAIATWNFRSRSERSHTERYGKKYAWIAYFEQYGLRHDQGLLETPWGGQEERSSDMDIDPSFPDDPHEVRLIENIVGDRTADVRTWVEHGPTPEFRQYLLQPTFDKLAGPWILLDGHCSQHDKDAERLGFVRLQSFLLLEEDLDEFIRLMKREPPRGKWLPDAGDDHYTFAGEISWCDTFPRNELQTVDFVTGKASVKVSPDPRYKLSLVLSLGNSKQTIGPSKTPKVEQINLYAKIPVYVPIRNNRFTPNGGVQRTSCIVPTKELADLFRLWLNLPSWNMHDQFGKPCSVVAAAGSLGDYEQYLFFRKELIDELLSSQQLALVWVAWGERQHFGDRYSMTNARSHGYRYFQQVYRYAHGQPERVESLSPLPPTS